MKSRPGSMSGNTRLNQAIGRIVFPRSPLRASFPRNCKFDQDFELRQCSPGMGKSGNPWEGFTDFPLLPRSFQTQGAVRSAAARTSLEEISEVDLGSWLIGKREGLIRILVWPTIKVSQCPAPVVCRSTGVFVRGASSVFNIERRFNSANWRALGFAALS